ncbi:hypothetical protein F4808DRAFT_285991 [Astrocystis sublimbata]|nr:hypothetical protein F4808DRAFT_285991 [Astrocystis sublimbata]
MDPAGAKRVGAGLLGDVEEESLDELLASLRAPFSPHQHPTGAGARVPHLPMRELAALTTRYQRATGSAPLMSVNGRYLPFLYHLLSTLLAAPHCYTVVVIDVEGKFDVTRLVRPGMSRRMGNDTRAGNANQMKVSGKGKGKGVEYEKGREKGRTNEENPNNYPATPADLAHLHIFRPDRDRDHSYNTPDYVRSVLAQLDDFMVYGTGTHGSSAREWWGTVLIGGGTGGTVNAGYKGWLKVECEEVPGFMWGISLEEACVEREARKRAVEGKGWEVRCAWGVYGWMGRERG